MKSALGVALIVAWFTVMVLAYAEPRQPATTPAVAAPAQPMLSFADGSGRWQLDVDLAVAIGFASEPRPTEVALAVDSRGAVAIRHAGKDAITLQSR